jgi:hypothetical protein
VDTFVDFWWFGFSVASRFWFVGTVGYDHRLWHCFCGVDHLQLSEPVCADDGNFSLRWRHDDPGGFCFSRNFYLGECWSDSDNI